MVFDLNKEIFILVFCVGLFIMYLWCKKKKFRQYRYWILGVFWFYILSVVKLTFFPVYINWDGNLSEIVVNTGEIMYLQLIPFKSIYAMLEKCFWFRQIMGNVVLLLPLPIFIGVLQLQKDRTCYQLACIGIGTSIAIELFQYIVNQITRFPNRVTDIDDIILNSVGVWIGALIFKKVRNYLV